MKQDKIIIPKNKLQSLYLDKRLSTAKIADIYNCNAETIRRRLIEYGTKRRFREIKIKLPIKELKKLYLENKLSTLELSRRYKCSQWTIWSNLMRNNIKLRDCSDFLKWKNRLRNFNSIDVLR